MGSPIIARAHKETITRQSTRQMLSSVSPVQVLYVHDIIQVEQVVSTVKKTNHSP